MIKVVGPQHLDEVKLITDRAFPQPWTTQDLQFFLEHPCGFHWGVFEGGVLKSFVLSLLVSNTADIITVATQIEVQRQGLQKELFNYIKGLDVVSHVTLEVDVFNEKAFGLYEKVGFKVAGIRKKYYEKKRDAYLMVWKKEQEEAFCSLFANPRHA